MIDVSVEAEWKYDVAKNGMRPIHPGEILREEFLVPLGMSAYALSKALRVTPSRVNDIVHEKRRITANTALRLSRYFGGDPQSWLNLQQTYDLKVGDSGTAEIIDEIEPLSQRKRQQPIRSPPDSGTLRVKSA